MKTTSTSVKLVTVELNPQEVEYLRAIVNHASSNEEILSISTEFFGGDDYNELVAFTTELLQNVR